MSENKINFLQLIKIIASNWKKVMIISLSFFILGIFVAFTLNLEYDSSCKLLPESQDSNTSALGQLGGLAGLAGINLNMSSSSSLNTEIYPDILNSTPFITKLLNMPINCNSGKDSVNSRFFFQHIYNKSIWTKIINGFKGIPGIFRAQNGDIPNTKNFTGVLNISNEEWELIESYKHRISIKTDANTGLISINVTMPDPLMAASVTNNVIISLTEEATNYKTKKARLALNFIQKSCDEVEIKYLERQKKLAAYVQKNRNVTDELHKLKIKNLTNDLSLSYDIYKGLTTQLEQAKISLNEQTPIFTIVEAPRVPLKKSQPKRILIIMLFSFLGFFLSVLILLYQKTWKQAITYLKN